MPIWEFHRCWPILNLEKSHPNHGETTEWLQILTRKGRHWLFCVLFGGCLKAYFGMVHQFVGGNSPDLCCTMVVAPKPDPKLLYWTSKHIKTMMQKSRLLGMIMDFDLYLCGGSSRIWIMTELQIALLPASFAPTTAPVRRFHHKLLVTLPDCGSHHSFVCVILPHVTKYRVGPSWEFVEFRPMNTWS